MLNLEMMEYSTQKAKATRHGRAWWHNVIALYVIIVAIAWVGYVDLATIVTPGAPGVKHAGQWIADTVYKTVVWFYLFYGVPLWICGYVKVYRDRISFPICYTTIILTFIHIVAHMILAALTHQDSLFI